VHHLPAIPPGDEVIRVRIFPSMLFWPAVILIGLPRAVSAGELLPDDDAIEAAIDHYVGARLSDEGLVPASPASEGEWIRRLTLDLVGRIPTVAEARAFIESSDAGKRAAAIDRLMASPAFVRHQATALDAYLMSESRGSVKPYLLSALAENRTWDAVFRDLLLADRLRYGMADDDARKKELGEAEPFVRARVADTDRLANDVSILFFGVNVSCAQCHDHPFVSTWTQDYFYGMKSFFARTFDNGGFVAERDYGMVAYKTTEGESRDAKLMFLTGKIVEEPAAAEPTEDEKKREKEQLEEHKKNKTSPPPPSYSRREALVEAALETEQSRYFARAIVNRMFARIYGRGLVTPLDQMHDENSASHPELLDWLARDFQQHGYDLRRLIRGLVSSEAYARSSRWEGDEWPRESLLAVAAVRPLTPMQYATSLHIAAANPDKLPADMQPEELERRIESFENAARGIAGALEQPGEDFQVSVTEALYFSNNDRVRNDLLRDSGDTLVGKLKTLGDNRQVIETAVWSAFGRPPEEEEFEALDAYLREREDRRDEALRQLVWSLLTSSELRFNY
jgi:hypothetical protein